MRLENKKGAKVKRFEPSKPAEKGDWVGDDNIVYDGCSPPKAKFFDSQIKSGNYEQSLKDHLAHPTVDRVVVDTSDLGLTDTRMQTLDELIEKIAGPNNPKIVRIP